MAYTLLVMMRKTTLTHFVRHLKKKIKEEIFMKNIIQLVVLTLALSVGVFAQFEPNEPVQPQVVSFVGDQGIAGDFVDMTQKVEGNSFIFNGSTKEYRSVLVTVAFDYYGMPDYNTGNEVSGGLWNVAVYTKKGDYKGSIFGTVVGGSINWSIFQDRRAARAASGGSSRTTKATLTIVGGTGEYYDITRSDVLINIETDLTTGASTATMDNIAL